MKKTRLRYLSLVIILCLSSGCAQPVTQNDQGFQYDKATAWVGAHDPEYLYGIHWYDRDGTVEEMTSNRGIWVLETLVGYQSGFDLAGQIGMFNGIVQKGHTLVIRIQPDWGYAIPAQRNEWSAYITKVVEAVSALRDLCHIWQIGNEMNLRGEFGGRELSAADYIEFYKQIRPAIKAVGSGLAQEQTVLVGPVCLNDAYSDMHTKWRPYLTAMCTSLGQAGNCDGFALHAYGPNYLDVRGACDEFRNSYRDQLQIIDSHGFRNKPAFILEWNMYVEGFNSNLEAKAAQFLGLALKELAEWNASGNHWIACACWFVYKDDDEKWREYSIRYLHGRNPGGKENDLWESFQAACNGDYPNPYIPDDPPPTPPPTPTPTPTPPPPPVNSFTNGDFSQGMTGWTVWHERATTNAGTSNQVLSLDGINFNGGVYQQFATGGAGTTLYVDGFWRALNPQSNSQWAEVLIINADSVPVNGTDVTGDMADVILLYKNDTWNDPSGWNGQISSVSDQGTLRSFTAAGPVATIVIKAGSVTNATTGIVCDNMIVSDSPNPPPTPTPTPTPPPPPPPTSNIYRWLGGTDWDAPTIDGLAERMSVANNGHLWVVNSEGMLWRWNGSSWDPIRDSNTQDVGCGANGTIVITTRDVNGDGGYILRLANGQWTPLDDGGRAKRVDVDSSGNVWVVNGQGDLWVWNGSWHRKMTANAQDVGCGPNGMVIAILKDDNSDGGKIMQYLGGENWQPIDGRAVNVDVANDGSVWVVNKVGLVWQYANGGWFNARPSGGRDIGCNPSQSGVWITVR